MKRNRYLNQAKEQKRDEFYTPYSVVAKELDHYKHHFKGKSIYLPADKAGQSAFWEYFKTNYKELGLTGLRASHKRTGKSGYTSVYNGYVTVRDPLTGNGDFRSESVKERMRAADIIITNPPFSLIREFIGTLDELGKSFIFMGNTNAINSTVAFPLIQEGKMWLGQDNHKTVEFELPSDYEKYTRIDERGKKYGKVPAISWFTNLEVPRRTETLDLSETFDKSKYPTYDNSTAIEVNRVKNIPTDYPGVMGVPITFLAKHNPEQFEIVGFRKGDNGKDLELNGKVVYMRVLIRKKEQL